MLDLPKVSRFLAETSTEKLRDVELTAVRAELLGAINLQAVLTTAAESTSNGALIGSRIPVRRCLHRVANVCIGSGGVASEQ